MNQPEKSFYRVSIKALVSDSEHRFLLLEQPNGYWDLPGGGLDYGEDHIACLSREIREEIGGTLVSVSQSPLLAYSTTNLRGMMVYNVIYAVTLQNETITVSDECIAARFVSPNDAANLQLVPGAQRFLELYPLQN